MTLHRGGPSCHAETGAFCAPFVLSRLCRRAGKIWFIIDLLLDATPVESKPCSVSPDQELRSGARVVLSQAVGSGALTGSVCFFVGSGFQLQHCVSTKAPWFSARFRARLPPPLFFSLVSHVT